METSGYCLTADKKLYKLTAKVTGEAAANGKCEADVTAGDRQFSTAGDSITIQGEITGLIYNCKADQTKPNTDPVTCTPITTGYYMSSTNLYHCSNSICSAVTLSEEGYYIDASSKDATGNYASLIKCTLNSSNKCEFENASSAMPSTANEVYYFKNGQNSKKLIQCTFSTSVSCLEYDPKSKVNGYYLNAEKKDTKTGGSTVFKGLLEFDGSDIITVDLPKGVFVDATTGTKSGDETTYTSLITCDENKECTSNTATAGYYNNGAVSSTAANKLANALIECAGSTCKVITPTENTYFVDNATETGKNLIKCSTLDGCVVLDKSDTNNASYYGTAALGNKYYINSGASAKSADKKYLIKCSTTQCEETALTDGKIYINGNYGDDPTNYLIKCTSTLCEPYASTDFKDKKVTIATKEHYLNGDYSASDLTNAIIEVIFETDGKKRDGKSLKPKVSLKKPSNGFIYINSIDKKLIQCIAASCSSNTSLVGSSDAPTYFVNGDPADEDESFNNLLIKCTGTCTPANGKANGVLINGNYKDSSNTNGEGDNRLIVCSDKKCSTFKDASKIITYFVNSEAAKTDYSDALIKCPVFDVTTPCVLATKTTEVDANNVYLNGNFKDSSITTTPFTDTTNYLIICSGGKCSVVEGKTSSGETFYLNSGHSDRDPLKDSLIKCTNEKCAAEDLSRKIISTLPELYYINANYGTGKDTTNYLIKCQFPATKGCAAVGTASPTATDVEHYVNGAQTEFNNAVIEVTFGTATENKKGGKKRATKPLIATTKFAENVQAGSVFINTSTKKLIQCSTVESATPKDSCAAFDGSGTPTSDIPHYYINAAVATASDYDKLLILCNGTECKEEKGRENGIYLNANLYHATNNKNGMKDAPLIICSGASCVSANSNLKEDNAVEYFINSGKYISSSKSNVLIKCTQTSGTISCVADLVVLKTKDPKDVFYINGNYGKDGNYLIKCTAIESCTLYVSEDYSKDKVTVNTKEHYVYGAASGLTNAIIEVAFSNGKKRAITAVPTIITATAETIYINSATEKLIQCTASLCEAFAGSGSEKKPVYYKNASVKDKSETFTDAIIKCNGTKCELQDGHLNNVYLNGNLKGYNGNSASADTKQLIVCSEGECNVTASAITKGYEFFINAGDYNDGTVDYPLIKCRFASPIVCAEEKVAIGDVQELFYINGNYNSDETKKRDSVNYLIKCVSASECVSYKSNATEAGKKHFVHGAPNKLKEAVIECDLAENTSESEDAEPFTATCTLIAEASENNIYINGSENTQIIRCTSDSCKASNTSPTDKKSEYYMNSVDTTKKSLIKCSKANGCEVEELTEEDSKIFINSNYGSGKDEDNQLIKCPDGVCDLKESSATEKPEFYVNGDETNVEYKKGKGGIIKCIKGDSDVKCSEINANNDNVYLNANYDVSKKQIILCKETDSDPEDDVDETGCNEVSVEVDSDANELKYYVNSGSVNSEKLTDTLIKCSNSESACEIFDKVNESEIYINANTEQLIYCSKESGCEAKQTQANKDNNEFYLNSSDLNNEKDKLTNDLIRCIETDEKTKKCEAFTGKADFVYIDSYTKGNIIYCTDGNGCKSKASFTDQDKNGLPKFYVNGDDIDFDDKGKDKDPLNGDLIKCTKIGTENDYKVNCIIAKGDNNNVYLNSNYSKEDGDAVNQLIICTEKEGCLAKTCSSSSSEETDELEKRQEELDTEDSSEKFPKYYINSANPNKFENGIIQCTSVDEACTLQTAKPMQVYKNANDNESLKPIIKCGNNNCKTYESFAYENSNEYYKNAGDDGETPLKYDIIECSYNEGVITCTELEEINEGVYLNSNYIETGDKEQLIQCSKDNGCLGLRSESKDGEYYVNAEADDLKNAIIFCSNKKCEKQTPIAVPTYYVGSTQEGEVNGLIECIKSEVVADTTASTGSTGSSRRKRGTEEKCKLKSAFTSNGYFLNAGYNKSVNQTIICDSTDGCETRNVDLGYYVNAGDDTKPNIKCEKEGNECYSEESNSCPQTSDAVAGNYCYEEGLLKFFPEGNSTAIAASKSDDIYTFATIPSGGFPGIKSETGALFKISRYFINRFYQSGIVMIDKNGKLVDNLSSADQSEVSLYDCNDSTKICTLRPGCTSNTYMYDSENKKAVFCNSGKLEYAEFTGYVVDGNRMVGTNHPYIIECQNNGNNCKSIKPKISSYYENSGYDSSSNSLIECYNNNCVTKTADVGYYVGHEGEGIIQCTSSTSCNYSKSKSKVKYVNAGYNKSSSAIISCAKNSCSAVKAEIGYYLTYINTLLIYCSSPSNCVEFTPTVNYFENADSTESSSTIINCDQNSQVITCALEATGNGFYLSSSPNELILCKSGNKCKTVKVKNGIFSSAVKTQSTTSNRRSDDDDDVELSEDGNSVTIPRDSDDSYNIIRCIQEKCSALSPSEIAAIPICEFNNNKCYITLEYSMTKSATTSITAGNICTNADRSIFYFATDTIVVKPNVISGVTATYVYTTTNSNCLEVNDSYSDMYFTVGSNIYLLDQGSVLQFYEQGYYFINTAKNSIVSGNDIDSYNDENVKLYKCNGSSCSIMDKPDSLTYYADVNKRIIRYNVNSDSYSFAYDKDITCIFANNKCTPNADLKNQEFCITYKGELALATADIKNRETGECYKASTISSNIYGYSQYLYSMNVYSAQMIDETGYYIVSLSTNTTVVSKNYKTKNNNLVIYGCQLSSCKQYIPDENTYYYDARAKNILRYKDGIWSSPANSGYAYISIDPTNTYIYRFTKNLDEIKINAMANYGYYYTVDDEMYHCDSDEDGGCSPIENTGYYFTNAGEVYYCVHDSEELEPTECTKQACVSGQYYYIEDAYYRCESSSTLVPVMSRYCSYNDNVIINFPLALTEEFPDKIKQAMEGIEKNNNSTAIVSRRGKNYLESVSGVFTNCTYNVEETKSTFDLVCVNNFVSIDENTDDVKICSMEQLGYVECIEDEENPEKCNISGSLSRLSISIVTIVIISIFSIFFNYHN